MDSTLLKIEVIDELARKMGVVDQVSQITEQAMNGGLDFDQSLRARVRLLKGMPHSVIQEIIDDLPLMEGAEKLIRTLKSLGYKVAILSGGFINFVDELKKRLGVDFGFANKLEFIDGIATGEVLGEIINGEKKLHYMKKIASEENLEMNQVIAIGDGANDLPMIGAAGLGIAFRAKPLVRASADHSLATLGLDGVLYLLGIRDSELEVFEALPS
jgi:phosphoserine phosphatase